MSWRPDNFDTEEVAKRLRSKIINPNGTVDLIEAVDIVADAMLQKVWEWGMEECPHFLHIHRYRCQCPECWETLRQEAGKE